jgi:hypothetical protein
MPIIPIVTHGIVGLVPGVSELVWVGLFGPLRLPLLLVAINWVKRLFVSEGLLLVRLRGNL